MSHTFSEPSCTEISSSHETVKHSTPRKKNRSSQKFSKNHKSALRVNTSIFSPKTTQSPRGKPGDEMTDSRPLLSDAEPIDLVSQYPHSQELQTPNGASANRHSDYGSASPSSSPNSTSHSPDALTLDIDEDPAQSEIKNLQEVEVDDYKPYFCWITIILNCLAFVVTIAYAKWEFLPLSKNPMLGPRPEILDELGAKDTAKLVDGEWWRLILPMYMHGGVFHLAINMFVLWRLGCDLERVFGWARVGSIYMLSGISGTLMSAIFVPEILGVGASGALYGLIGSLYGDLIHNWKSLGDNKTCYIIQLVVSTVVGLAVGLMPLLDNFAHVGGFIAGFFAGCVFLHNPIRARNVPFYQYFFFYISIAFLIFWFVASGIILFTGVDANGHCSWCQYLSCVELPIWSCSPEILCYVPNPEDGSPMPVTCEPE